jgi:nucleoporin POM34
MADTNTSRKPHLPTPPAALAAATRWATHLLRAALVLAAMRALRPLLGPTDDLSDIPLTPRQRSLLGLRPVRGSPSSVPGTPGGTPGSAPGSPAVAGYVTPPRFVRAASGALASSVGASSRAATLGSSPPTPGGRTPSSAGARSSVGSGASPFGAGGSLLRGPARNDFALSPAGASPLVRKAVHGKRWSLNGSGFGESGAGAPGSPSPAPTGNGAGAGSGGSRSPSVTLTNKWLYQRQWSGNGPARYI